MYRKMMSLLLALALVCACLPALAATGSKTTSDMTTTGDTSDEAIIVVKPQLTETAQSALNDLSAVVNGGGSAASYFPADVQSAIGAKLPAGTTADDLKLSELISLGAYNLDDAGDTIVSTIGFATEYTADQTIAVVFGYKDASGNMVWTTLDAVVVNGMLKVTFPVDLLKLAGSDAVLAVLSN